MEVRNQEDAIWIWIHSMNESVFLSRIEDASCLHFGVTEWTDEAHTSNQANPYRSTNGVSLRRDYLFLWPMADGENCVKKSVEICLKKDCLPSCLVQLYGHEEIWYSNSANDCKKQHSLITQALSFVKEAKDSLILFFSVRSWLPVSSLTLSEPLYTHNNSIRMCLEDD